MNLIFLACRSQFSSFQRSLGQTACEATAWEGEATVRSIRLVCGARRESIGEDMLTLHRLHVGSHLSVLDDQPTGLWRVQRQRELLLKRGGTVQVEASLGIESILFAPRNSESREHRQRSECVSDRLSCR